MPVVTKGEFARLCNVTPARVSQWLAAGKIDGDAIVGVGRNAQIDVEKAQAQLQARLDVDQRHSGNGLSTRLGEAPPPGPSSLPLTGGGSDLEQQLLEERVIAARRANREKDTAEAVANGRLVDADEAKRAAAKEIAQVIARLDGAMPEIAAALAAKFHIPQRDVVHVMRAELRKVRAAGAIEARERAEPLPETVGFDLDPDSEC